MKISQWPSIILTVVVASVFNYSLAICETITRTNMQSSFVDNPGSFSSNITINNLPDNARITNVEAVYSYYKCPYDHVKITLSKQDNDVAPLLLYDDWASSYVARNNITSNENVKYSNSKANDVWTLTMGIDYNTKYAECNCYQGHKANFNGWTLELSYCTDANLSSFHASAWSFNPTAGDSVTFSGNISSSTSKTWTLTITGAAGTVAKYSGTYGGGASTSVSRSWDGRDPAGRIVPPGTYTAAFSAASGQCSSNLVFASVQVLPPPPPKNSTDEFTPSLEVCAGSTNNVASGALSHSQPLFATKGIPLSTSIDLFYNSLDSYDGPLGLGWSHSYDTRLTEYGDSILLSEGNGTKRLYTLSGGVYESQKGDSSTLVKNSDGYAVTFRDGLKYNFDSKGKLTSIIDRYNDNNKVLIGYNTNGDITSITDPAGRITTVKYVSSNSHRIDYITDPNGKVYNFTYKGNTLWQVFYPAANPTISQERGFWEYLYYSEGHLKSKKDPNGNLTQYYYDSNHRLESVIDPEGVTNASGHTRKFEYLTSTGNINTTEFTEKDGSVWVYTYDTKAGVLTAKTDPNGKATSYTYDSDLYLKSVTKPGDGEPEDAGVLLTTFYSHDKYGNLTDETEPSISNPASVDVTKIGTANYPLKWAFHYTYDTNYYDERTSVTDLRGTAPLTTTFAHYQENGLFVTRITEPGQDAASPRISYLRRNSDGSLQSATDANSKTATYIYYPKTKDNSDAGKAGMLQSVTDKNSITVSYTDYDKYGNVKKTKVARADGLEVPVSTTMVYDDLNRLTNITKKSTITPIPAFTDLVTKYGYDKMGNMASFLDAEMNSRPEAQRKETKYQYNFLGQRTKVTDALQNVTDYVYSGSGCPSCGAGVDQLTGIKHNDTTQITYQYDRLGRLERENHPLGKATRYTYYDSGLLKEKFDATATPEKRLVTYYYNSRGQVTDRIYTDGRSDHFQYKNNGSIESAATALDGTTVISYTYTYHDDGRLKSVTSVANNTSRTISYDLYDGLGQRKQVTVLKGTSDQRVISYDYDEANRPWHIYFGNNGSKVFTFDYDTRGRKHTLNYPNETAAEYLYDDLNRLTSLTHSAVSGASFTYPEFDGVDNRKAAGRDGDQWSYLFDNLYRLLEKVSPTQPEKFTYDPIGNRQAGPGPKDTDYLHNKANQMTQGRKLAYDYDSAGNQTMRIEPWASDRIWTQTWDNENRLIKVEKLKGMEKRIVTFTYDPFGRRVGKQLTTVINGVKKASSWSFVYDNEDIAVEIFTDETATSNKTFYIHGPGIDEPLALERNGQFYYYHADGLGSIAAITDQNRNVVQSYDYDTYGMVKPTSPTFVNSYAYTGREWDKEAGLFYYRARYYDPMEGRFISKDPIGFAGGDINLYGYVQNNPVNMIDPLGLEGFDSKKWAQLTNSVTYYSTKYNDRLNAALNFIGGKIQENTLGVAPPSTLAMLALGSVVGVFTQPTELSDPVLKNGNWVFPNGDMRPCK